MFSPVLSLLLGIGLGLRQVAPEFLVPLGWAALFLVVAYAYWWGATWLWRRGR